MAGSSVQLRLPPARLFKFPPDPEPAVLPAPAPNEAFRTFAAPFAIDPKLYNDLMSVYVPITIASVYAVVVLYMNNVNSNRGGKPWAVSRTSVFFAFVILHNVALAVFSGLVFWAMLRALAHTWPSHREYPLLGKLWPGIRTQYGLAGATDALCKMHGPRGFGDAAAFSAKKGIWEIKNRVLHLGQGGLPDSTDVGRLWNEGLAFWGWFFYLSKFYEVIDTAIIILKGKRSSTLQTYHHAGAMFCMWAGMRYMSPPIWMFVWINSGIHAMMYTYYTLSALGFRVPRRIKKSITTMQIAQFLIGFTYAAGHLFVTYTIPSYILYGNKYGIKDTGSGISAAASKVAAAVAEATAAHGLSPWLRKLAFRAAGEEGLAENVRDQHGQVFGPEADHVHESFQQMKKKIVTFSTVDCIDTTGQSFAIWLNLIYLAPLTWLFLRFFIRSYSRRMSIDARRRRVSRAAEDAAHGIKREMDGIGRRAEKGFGKLDQEATNGIHDSKTIQSFRDALADSGGDLMKRAAEFSDGAKEQVQDSMDSATESAKNLSKSAKKKAKKAAQKAKQEADDQRNGIKTEERSPSPQSPQDSGVLVDISGEPTHEGLSTTNPNDTPETYADKVK